MSQTKQKEPWFLPEFLAFFKFSNCWCRLEEEELKRHDGHSKQLQPGVVKDVAQESELAHQIVLFYGNLFHHLDK